MSMQDGQQPQGLVIPQMPIPSRGELLQQGLAQVTMADGTLVIVLTMTGPGRTWQAILEGQDAINWGQQLVRWGEMTVAGLIVPNA